MDPELEEQMKMLEGLGDMDLNAAVGPELSTPVQLEIAPTNPSVVQTLQEQANQQAAAQVVVPTQTSTVPPQSYTTIQPIQPIQQPTNPVAAPIQPIQAPDMNQAPVFVNLATSAYQTKTDFLSLKEGEKTKVTLANLNFIRNHIHYIDGLGKIRCLSSYDENNRWPVNRAICCQFVDEKTGKQINAKNRLLVPVIEYPVSRTDGKTVIQGAKPKLKMWDMNYVEEKQLMDILENYKTGDDWSSIDITSFDLNLIKGKSGEYATITLTPMPSWRANFIMDINAAVSSITQEFYTDAYKESARIVTEESIRNSLIQKQQQQDMAQHLNNQPPIDIASMNLNV